MPTYRITAPDGVAYNVTAPDGATQEEVLAYAQQNYQQKPRADFSGVSSTVDSTERDANARTLGDQYNSIFAGLGKSMYDTGAGIVQRGTEAVGRSARNAAVLLDRAGLEGAGRSVAQNIGRPVEQSIQSQRDATARRRELDPSFSEDPAFATGNIVGTLGQLLGPGLLARGTVAAQAFLPTTIGGNAAQGAALGALQPSVSDQETAGNTAFGGVAGTLGSAIPRAIGAGYRPIRNALADLMGQPTATGVERRAADLIRQEAADPAALGLRNPSQVPNVQRTLAEETLDPGVARLERQMRGSGAAGVFTPLDQANAAARVNAVQGIAGTEADMAAALAARNQASQQARDEAMQSGPVDISQTILQLDQAIASQEGRPAVQAGLTQVRDLLLREQQGAPGLAVGTVEDRIPVLDNVRQTIGDMLGGRYGGENAAALQGSRELIGVRNQMNDEISAQAPAFGEYLDAYRQGSIPINRMEIGRELLDRGAGGAIPDAVTGIRPLTPAAFGRQVNDLDALAARATGFDRARADQILQPQDIATLRAIQDDLSRQNFRATAGSGGNSMTQERQALGRRLGRGAIQSVPIVGRFAEILEQAGERRLTETLSRLIADPAEYQRVAAALPPADRAVLNQALLQLSARPAAAAPALAE